MKLSKRLEKIASFVRKGSKIADIGTDHGYIPIFLAENGTVLSALAMDVRTGPLERARRHILEHGLEERIGVRLSDGMAALSPGEADTVIIAGMGGGLSVHILEEGRHMWESVRHFILSPQSDIASVRHFLAENGFSIEREAMVEEDGKYYTVMDVCRGPMSYEKECEYRYGRLLIEKNDPVLAEYLRKEEKALTGIAASLGGRQGQAAQTRLEEIKEELLVIKEAYDEMQRHN